MYIKTNKQLQDFIKRTQQSLDKKSSSSVFFTGFLAMAYRFRKRLTCRSLFTIGSIVMLLTLKAIGNHFQESMIEISHDDTRE